MRFVETLGSYLPALIVRQLQGPPETQHVPRREGLDTVCLFADIKGFTALSEAMEEEGAGSEGLAKYLNMYFSQMCRIIASEGGDVFKYAGDAMIVLWEVKGGDEGATMEMQARRATQCAVALQSYLHSATLDVEEQVTLSVKLGIGVGHVSVLHIGGSLNRMEYLAVGEPLVQAFTAEGLATAGGQVILSADAWREANASGENFVALQTFPNGFVELDTSEGSVISRLPKRSKVVMMQTDTLDEEAALEKNLRCYVPGAVLPTLSRENPDEESWGSELRTLSVLFINLGLKEHDLLASGQYDDAMVRVHKALCEVQSAVYKYEGSVNKFLMDDKGSTVVAAFGLAPFCHENDAVRAVLSALLICEKLFELGLVASVGVTTGTGIFCGVVGSKTRREYSVLGDSVNLAARLMQQVKVDGDGGVLCDTGTQRLAISSGLLFHAREPIEVKGKTGKIDVFEPYDNAVGDLRVAPAAGAFNAMRAAHARQRQAYARDSILKARLPRVVLGGESNRMNTAPGLQRKRSRAGSAAQLLLRPKKTSASSVVAMGGRAALPHQRGLHSQLDLLQQLLRPISSALIVVPHLFRLDAVLPDSARLAMIDCEGVEDTDVLFEKAIAAAVDAGMLTAEQAAAGPALALNISGTRSFVPRSTPGTPPVRMRWLPHFAVEASAGSSPKPPSSHIELNLVQSSDASVEASDLARLRFKLLEKKIALVERGEGSAVVIEGEVGAGKTTALCRFVALTLPKAVPIYCTSGSPFERTALLGVWWMVLRQQLDTHINAVTESAAAGLGAARRAAREDSIRSLLGARAAHLLPFVALLNTGLGVSFEHTDQSRALEAPGAADKEGEAALKKQRRVRRVRVDMLVALLRANAHKHKCVVIIDDALYLDPASWDVALALASKDGADACPLLLVIATRPLRNYTDPFVLQVVPRSFGKICRAGDHMKLRGLKDDELEELVCDTLGPNVASISGRLRRLIETRAQGNPLMVKEEVLALMNSADRRLVFEPQQLGEGGSADGAAGGGGAAALPADMGAVSTELLHCSLAKGLDFEGEINAMPCAFSMLGTRIDRLNSCQKMILKTASLIGSNFLYSFLLEVYPIEGHRLRPASGGPSRLQSELRALEEMGIICSLPPEETATEADAAADDVTYEFTYSCSRGVLQQYMLSNYQDMLLRKVRLQEEVRSKADRKRFIEHYEALGLERVNKSGPLSIRRREHHNQGFLKGRFKRSVQGDWKQRWVELTADSFEMFREEGDAIATQKVHLSGATAKLQSADDFDMKDVFVVSAKSFNKQDQLQGRRDFYLSAEDPKSAEQWVYMIRFVIERLALKEAKDEAQDEAKDEAPLAQLPRAPSQVDRPLRFESDSRLLVLVQGARAAGPSGTLGSLFVTIELEGELRRTEQISAAAPALAWNDEFVFEVPREAWGDGVLSLFLWNRDPILSDDFLGAASLRLADLTLESADTSGAELHASDATWHKLQSGGSVLAEGACFELCVATKHLRKPTTEPAMVLEADTAAAEAPAEQESGDRGEFDLVRAIDAIAAKVSGEGGGGVPDAAWLGAELAKLKAGAIASSTGRAAALSVSEGGVRPSSVSREELDEENLRWLTSEYTRERKLSAASHSAAAVSTVNAHEFYYLDDSQAENGPFTATVMRAWLDAGFMHNQVLVRQGTAGEFRPLDTHSALVKHQTSDSLDWPRLPTAAQHAAVLDWDFNIWTLQKAELPSLAGSILAEMDIPSAFEVGAS